MIITEQQYNSVVSGLRTQLELYRAHAKEKTDALHAVIAENERLRVKVAELTGVNRILDSLIAEEHNKNVAQEATAKPTRKRK